MGNGNKYINVNVDPHLYRSINSHDKINPSDINSPERVRINLRKLILAVGTILTRRSNPTKRNKFLDFEVLLEVISKNSNDLSIVKNENPEVQAQNSKELGVGLSVLIADYFYGLEWSTLAGIIRRHNESKPDIKVFSKQGKQIVMEAKGTTSHYSLQHYIKKALRQKTREPADIKIGSCALLRDDTISEVEFFDPEPERPINKKLTRQLFKADHYTRLFNLMGQPELSKYFSFMRKRIEFDTNFEEYYKKEEMYEKIKKDYVRISIRDKTYLGSIERINGKKYFFIGADRDLISFNGFLNFKDYAEDYVTKERENDFYVMTDGICLADLKNLDFVEDQLKGREIYHYQETASIADIDRMNHQALSNYFSYLFEKVGCQIIKEFGMKNVYADLLIEYQNRAAVIEIKKVFKDKENIFRQLLASKEALRAAWAILITSEAFSENDSKMAEKLGIKIIDRMAIRKIINSNMLLIGYLK